MAVVEPDVRVAKNRSLNHEEILTVVRAYGHRECYLIMISPLLF